MTTRARVKMPDSAAKGDVIRIRTLLRHRMETGLRMDEQGDAIPRHIINRFVCRQGDVLVFDADLYPAVAANPYIEFYMVARRSGSLDFSWYEDGGAVYTARRELTVR